MASSAAVLSAAEAAASINPSLDAKAFQRLADRHGIPYHKLGRKRYYVKVWVALHFGSKAGVSPFLAVTDSPSVPVILRHSVT